MKATVAYDCECRSAEPVEIALPLSKSISNRLLMINALAGEVTPRRAVAVCDDTDVMLAALKSGAEGVKNIGAAGTAMRFLTAYYASLPGSNVVLDGTERMRQRPIGTLVDALRMAGAEIDYMQREGFPPLRIKGKRLEGGSVEINAGVSSQYISAMLMVAPVMTLGLHLTLKGGAVSLPYIEMTIAMMECYGAEVSQSQPAGADFEIAVQPSMYRVPAEPFKVEADWSAASYWYEIAALTGMPFRLKGLSDMSMQGDAVVRQLFEPLGVVTERAVNGMLIKCVERSRLNLYELNMQACPDLAQTVAATCCGLGQPFRITGLGTLPIKETDRLNAMKQELAKLGFDVEVSNGDTLTWNGARVLNADNQLIDTYKDHRMAMSMAPLAVLGEFMLDDAGVVTKSYPDFWEQVSVAGFTLTEKP